MKKRLRGLLCLWMAVLVAVVPAARAMAEGGEGNLYVYNGDSELSEGFYIGEPDQEGTNAVYKSFLYDLPISSQTGIENAVSVPTGSVLTGWKVWDYYSGMAHNPSGPDAAPIMLDKDGVITEELMIGVTNGAIDAYILLEPVFGKQSYDITLPNVPGCTVAPAEGNASPVEHGGSYAFTVTVAPGYTVSGDFTVSANGTPLTAETEAEIEDGTGINGYIFTYTIENITEAQTITVTGVAEKPASEPGIALTDGESWDNFHVAGVPVYFDRAQTVTITAGDESSGIQYCIADSDLFSGKEVEAITDDEKEAVIAAAGGWTSYTDSIVLEDDGTYVIYAKVGGDTNQTNYVNTDILVIDTEPPAMLDAINNMSYKGKCTFHVEDANLDSVTVDGEPVTLVGNEYTIMADCMLHTIIARDKAGNETKSTVYVFDEFEIGKTVTEGGSFTVTSEDGEVTVAEPNTEIVVTASADEGYYVDGIVVTKTGDENTQVTIADGRFTMPSYPVTVTVNFRKNTYKITLPSAVEYTVTPVNGSVSPAEYGSNYTFTVAIADGYKVSDSYAVSANGALLSPVEADGNTYTYTIGYITEAQEIKITGIVNATAPSVTITAENDSAQWKEFLSDISFDYFFNKAITLTVTAEEMGGDATLNAIWYYLADREYTEQELESAVFKWVGYTDAVTLSADGKHVLYVKVEDSNGNVAYANTSGIVIDTVIPMIFGVENGGVYYGDTIIQASDENLDTVMVDGIAVQLTNSAYTITADNQTHMVTVRDRAGNQIFYELHTFETWVRDGIQAGGARSLIAGTAYRLGSGQWKVSGDETVYEGGSSFYVAESGSYVFSQQ